PADGLGGEENAGHQGRRPGEAAGDGCRTPYEPAAAQTSCQSPSAAAATDSAGSARPPRGRGAGCGLACTGAAGDAGRDSVRAVGCAAPASRRNTATASTSWLACSSI